MQSQSKPTKTKAKKKPNKHRNKKVVVVIGNETLKFDSQGEFGRWIKLRAMERAGLIRDLKRQVPFELRCPTPDGSTAVVGVCRIDFSYRIGNMMIFEDFKNPYLAKEKSWRRNKKWIRLQYGIVISEIYKS